MEVSAAIKSRKFREYFTFLAIIFLRIFSRFGIKYSSSDYLFFYSKRKELIEQNRMEQNRIEQNSSFGRELQISLSPTALPLQD